MLHHAVMSRTQRPGLPGSRNAAEPADQSLSPQPLSSHQYDRATEQAVDDRRESDRLPFPAEIILVWNHDLRTRLRFRVIDAGDGGYRIRSATPVLEGTTGMVLRLLPGRGEPLDQAVMAAWVKPAHDDDHAFDIGLRCF